MKRFFLPLVLLGAGLIACNQTPTKPNALPTPPKALGVVELELDTGGISTARFKQNLRPAGVNDVENKVFFLPGTTVALSPTSEPYDYLVATFPLIVQQSRLPNLTLVALAQPGNIGNTAVSTIQNFGGVTNTAEQTRTAKLIIPTQAVIASGGGLVIDNSKADFQALTTSDLTEIATAIKPSNPSSVPLLNYGFSARCEGITCTANKREIPFTGNVTIALRVPKAATNTSYKFVMTFAVIDDTVSKVTRGLYPLESDSNTVERAVLVSAPEIRQVGVKKLLTANPSATFVDDVHTVLGGQGGSVQALDTGRLVVGGYHACALSSNNQAYCWGAIPDQNFANNLGQLGNGNAGVGSAVPVAVQPPANSTVPLKFSSITAGGFHTCGLTTTGKAYCWGGGGFGQLGNGNNNDSGLPVAVAPPANSTNTLTFTSISARSNYTCGITTTAAAYCWGKEEFGNLGQGLTRNGLPKGDKNIPVEVVGLFLGCFPTIGCAYEPPLSFSSISAGGSRTCAISTAGRAYCWGKAVDVNNRNSDSPVAVAPPANTNTPLTFSSISAGSPHTCGITTTGAAYCWSGGFFGELGTGNRDDSEVPVAVLAPNLSFSSITAGNGYTCGVATTGAGYCWGGLPDSGRSYDFGQLGNGLSGTGASVPTAVVAPANSTMPLVFSSIESSVNQTCGITTTGKAYCWGVGSYGQLGTGNTTDSLIPAAVDGAFGL